MEWKYRFLMSFVNTINMSGKIISGPRHIPIECVDPSVFDKVKSEPKKPTTVNKRAERKQRRVEDLKERVSKIRTQEQTIKSDSKGKRKRED